MQGEIGKTYCIGGGAEKSNLEVANEICNCLKQLKPQEKSYESLISFVEDRPGHDYRYSIDATNINNVLGWKPDHTFNEAIMKTVKWYIKNLDWCQSMMDKAGHEGQRIGLGK